MHDDPDETLFARVRAGDLMAFDALYERYEVRLFGYLRTFLPDRHDTEEVFHDAFLGALKSTVTAPLEPGGFRALLYRVARNAALNRRRAASRRSKAHAGAAALADVGGDASSGATDVRADEALEREELRSALDGAIARLPPSLGELYHLRSSGLSYEQMADVVDVPLGTVKSRMHQIVNVLREELQPWIAPR